MRALILLLVNVLITYHISAQSKPPINSSVYNNWPVVHSPSISNNGKYVMYTIDQGEQFKNKNVAKLIVTAANLKWEREFTNLKGQAKFSADSKYLIYVNENDSLCIIKLGTSNISFIANVSSYEIVESGWMAINYKSKIAYLTLRNITTGRELKMPNIAQFKFSGDGKILVTASSDKVNGMSGCSLKWFNLDNLKSQTIWQGVNPVDMRFDTKNRAIVFLSRVKGNTQIWYFDTSLREAKLITDDKRLLDSNLFVIDEIQKISSDGGRIFITVKDKTVKSPDPNAVPLNIWTYKDRKSQTLQLNQLTDKKYYAVVYLSSSKLVILTNNNKGDLTFLDGINDDWAELGGEEYASGENDKYFFSLISTKNGRELNMNQRLFGQISPEGKYYIYFNAAQNCFISYELSTGASHEITKGISTIWNTNYPNGANYARGLVAGWLKGDQGVLIYDKYDIWLADMAGKRTPVNITNGYGKKHNIMFFLSNEDYIRKSIDGNASIILTAFNVDTKDNGFFRIQIGKRSDPEKLTMGPYAYSLSRNPYVPNHALFEPIKSKDADVYLVQRESATESPNYFITKDFKKFTQISDVHPEKDYNWFTTSLSKYVTPDGDTCQGVLYKPENFNPNKRYPVLIHFYTNKSDNLHTYLIPEPSNGDLNIMWYASNGYLVFTPDIHYKYGDAYVSCLQSIVSAAKYLASLPFVDDNKMGIQGISWGGFQTNYLVTHTNLFAAACSSSSIADFVSHYNGYSHGGVSCQDSYGEGSHGPGKMLWDDPQWYLKNSPVMSADKVTTPLLMFETTKDEACPFVNALELYAALRRLGKKVWMLEYNDGNHGVRGKSAMDFDLRLQQFFNYYLKDAPPPKWMTEGRPANLKGIDNKLELDRSGSKP